MIIFIKESSTPLDFFNFLVYYNDIPPRGNRVIFLSIVVKTNGDEIFIRRMIYE